MSLINDALKKVQSGGESPGPLPPASAPGTPPAPQPNPRTLLAQGILIGGVLLILFAVLLVLVLLPFVRKAGDAPAPASPVASAPAAPRANAPAPAASSKATGASTPKLAPVDEDLPEVSKTLGQVAAMQASAHDSAAEVNSVLAVSPAPASPGAAAPANALPAPAAAPASPSVAAPAAATAPATAPAPAKPAASGPDPKLVEFVNAIEVCGASGDQVLLRFPGLDEARGYREGDVLDAPFEIAVFKITDRRVILMDADGHKFTKPL